MKKTGIQRTTIVHPKTVPTAQPALAPAPVILEVTFRVCERRDLRALEWEGLFRGHRRIIQSAFRRQERGHSRMLIAEVNGKPVGQVWMDLCRNHGEQVAHVWAMRVIPWLQGFGLGTRLLQAAEQMARDYLCVAMQLEVDQRNTRAAAFYERSGFRAIGRCERFEPYTTRQGRAVRLRRRHWLMEKRISGGHPIADSVPAVRLPANGAHERTARYPQRQVAEASLAPGRGARARGRLARRAFV